MQPCRIETFQAWAIYCSRYFVTMTYCCRSEVNGKGTPSQYPNTRGTHVLGALHFVARAPELNFFGVQLITRKYTTRTTTSKYTASSNGVLAGGYPNF